MNPRGPVPLVLGLILAVGIPQALNLHSVRRLIERDQMTNVVRHTRAIEAMRPDGILLMGNSRMGSDVDAATLSDLRKTPAHDLSLAGGSFSQEEAWLRRILETSSPKAIVLAVSPVDLSASFPGRERAALYIHGAGDLVPLILQGRLHAAATLADHLAFPAYRYRLELKNALKKAPPVWTQLETRRKADAALPPEERELEDYVKSWLPVFEILPDEEKALRAFLDLARRRSIPVVLVRLPLARTLLAHERRVADPRFGSLMREMASGTLGYLDFATEEHAERWRFADCNHLDPADKQAFTRELSARLAGLGMRE